MKHRLPTAVIALTLAHLAPGLQRGALAQNAVASPYGLTAALGDPGVQLHWTDRASNETGFQIIRQILQTGTWQAAVTQTAPANASGFGDAVGAGVYRYRVRATSATRNSNFTAWAVITVPSGSGGGNTPPPMPPAAPTGAAAADIGGGRAMLSWTDVSSNETGFRVERSPAFVSGPAAVGAGVTALVDNSGNGTFQYRVQAFNAVGASAFTPWVTIAVTSGASSGGGAGSGNIDSGWTQFTASADTRIVYVAASGSDANSGLSEGAPKRTIAAGYALLRSGFPDWLLLRSGDTWNEVFPAWAKSGRSSAEPMRVGSYGTGERPRVMCGPTSDGIYCGNWGAEKAHLAFTDLAFYSSQPGAGDGPAGIHMLGHWTDILVENCYAEKFATNFVFDSDTTNPITNLRFRRNVSYGAFRTATDHPQGAYFAGINGLLLEESVFDHNGWNEAVPGATPTIFRHNIYIQGNHGQPNDCLNVTTKFIISARAGATGMQQRAGGLCEGHVFLQNPVGIVMGTGGTLRNCVLLDSRDIDASLPRGLGIHVENANSGFEVYNNICAQRTTPGTWNIVAYSTDGPTTSIWFHDNVGWKWKAATGSGIGLQVWGTPSQWVRVQNNRFQQPTGGTVFEYGTAAPLTVSGNRYFSTTGAAFRLNGNDIAFSQWTNSTGETGATFGQVTFPDPDRTIATYMSSLGMTPSLDAFMTEAKKQSKSNWRTQFTAKTVGNYFRAGFGITPIP